MIGFKYGYIKCLMDLMKDKKDPLLIEKEKLLYIIMFNDKINLDKIKKIIL